MYLFLEYYLRLDEKALRPSLRHHIAHFCPNLDIARKCIRKCMERGKPAFCGKDHVCYCGHKYDSYHQDVPVNVNDTYAAFQDLYEKYFGPRIDPESSTTTTDKNKTLLNTSKTATTIDSNESGSKESGSKESGSKEIESKESGSKESGSKETESKEPESKETHSNETGSKETDSKETGSKETGSKETGSKETGSKETATTTENAAIESETTSTTSAPP
ncbi:unnamed protein product [Arctia plantaginis]|uniref:Uncharacterized protein n=1 Tax=Arctia plantaginis TaxID=874455 RepID=A0A8S1BB03_ARCPL|nr:unnamed protein product [Arctia plantaginis]